MRERLCENFLHLQTRLVIPDATQLSYPPCNKDIKYSTDDCNLFFFFILYFFANEVSQAINFR